MFERHSQHESMNSRARSIWARMRKRNKVCSINKRWTSRCEKKEFWDSMNLLLGNLLKKIFSRENNLQTNNIPVMCKYNEIENFSWCYSKLLLAFKICFIRNFKFIFKLLIHFNCVHFSFNKVINTLINLATISSKWLKIHQIQRVSLKFIKIHWKEIFVSWKFHL